MKKEMKRKKTGDERELESRSSRIEELVDFERDRMQNGALLLPIDNFQLL